MSGIGDFIHDVTHPADFLGNVGKHVSSAWKDYSGQTGQKSANQTNIALQKQQQDWEGMMSDTAVQRRSADLSAAGINPLLAAGSAADVPNVAPARVESTGKGIASAASSLVQTLAGSVNMLASAQQSRAMADYTAGAHTAQTVAETAKTGVEAEKVAQETRNLKEQFNVLLKETSLKEAQTAAARVAARVDAMTIAQKQALFPSFLEIQQNAARMSKSLTDKDVEMINSWIGTVGAAFRQASGGIQSTINAAGALLR